MLTKKRVQTYSIIYLGMKIICHFMPLYVQDKHQSFFIFEVTQVTELGRGFRFLSIQFHFYSFKNIRQVKVFVICSFSPCLTVLQTSVGATLFAQLLGQFSTVTTAAAGLGTSTELFGVLGVFDELLMLGGDSSTWRASS